MIQIQNILEQTWRTSTLLLVIGCNKTMNSSGSNRTRATQEQLLLQCLVFILLLICRRTFSASVPDFYRTDTNLDRTRQPRVRVGYG